MPLCNEGVPQGGGLLSLPCSTIRADYPFACDPLHNSEGANAIECRPFLAPYVVTTSALILI
jgi:hypothetical protein